MTEFDVRANDLGSGYHVEYVNTASLSYEISQKFGTYVEVAARFGNESLFGGIVVIGGGLLFKLSKDLQLDGGINVGVTRAPDA